ncbi:MAG: sigma-70 family RNA polymerase sigma factor [Thermoanaerobaculia bacterium]
MTEQRVLVVDDEVAIVEGLTALFEFEQIRTIGANDRESAEAILGDEFCPVIVTDLCLHTQMEGMMLLETIRAKSPRSRIVILSAFATPELEEELLQRGVAVVLRKPSSGDVIMEAVYALLDAIEKEAPAIDETLDLETLYLSVRKRLYDIPRHRFGLSADRAEDVLHDAWLLFLQKRGIIREAAPWLAGTVANLARQQLDKKKRRKETPEDDLGEMHDPRHGDMIDRVALTAALDRVDERTRQLCVLIGIEGLSYDEVSAATNLPLGSIGPLYIRAKKKLRMMLEN